MPARSLTPSGRPRSSTTLIKASFGFGDVNACVVYRKWTDQT